MIPWYNKIFIGAIGALCLSILKLISVNFYIGASNPSVALGAYLTFLSYIIMGMAVGYFLSDDNPDASKTRKNVFVMGLLAPSILLAIISKPVSDSPGGSSHSIPTLSSISGLLLPSAYGDEIHSGSTNADNGNQNLATKNLFTGVQMVSKRDVTPGFDAGVKSALGLESVSEPYVFVVGKTEDKAVATNTAIKLQEFFQKSQGQKDLRVDVLKADSQHNFYVTVGGMASPTDAAGISQKVKQSVKIVWQNDSPSKEDKRAVSLLMNGQLYKGGALFDKE